MDIITVVSSFSALVVGGVLTYFLVKPKYKSLQKLAEKEAENLKQRAHTDSDRIINDAQKQSQKIREDVRNEESQMRQRLEKIQEQADERISKREEVLEQKVEKVEIYREKYEKSRQEVEVEKEKLQKDLEKQTDELQKIAKLSKDEAEKKLFENLEKEIAPALAEVQEKRVNLMRENSNEEASNIIVQSIQRLASDVTTETTITTVKIESDDLKGKIIGREGRNIKAFEMMTGVDVIIDDTPGVITLASYDMFRRYIAKVSLESLVKDGRIHPSRIEESVLKAQNDAEKSILELGKRAVQELGLVGFSDEILKLLGRLRFRTSYGQNVLSHSVEVAWLAETIAQQLPGADPEVCKKSGLVHDIGKAVSHEVEGGHAVVGMEILEKFGVDEKVIVAMKSHHEDFPYETIESRIVQAADAISASRPGARRETLEKYIKRLKELESIAGSFEGVEKVFAIQAGREVRVFVNAEEVDDLQTEKLSFDIARKIEKSCDYPGEVQVAVFREKKAIDSAK